MVEEGLQYRDKEAKGILLCANPPYFVVVSLTTRAVLVLSLGKKKVSTQILAVFWRGQFFALRLLLECGDGRGN